MAISLLFHSLNRVVATREALRGLKAALGAVVTLGATLTSVVVKQSWLCSVRRSVTKIASRALFAPISDVVRVVAFTARLAEVR